MRKHIIMRIFVYTLITALFIQSTLIHNNLLINVANANEITHKHSEPLDEQFIIPDEAQYNPGQIKQTDEALQKEQSNVASLQNIDMQPEQDEINEPQQISKQGETASNQLLHSEAASSQLSEQDQHDNSKKPLQKQNKPNDQNQLLNAQINDYEEISGQQTSMTLPIEISFSQDNYNLVINEECQSVVNVVYSDNSVFDITRECTFNITDETIAEVDSNGLIHAKNVGQAQLFADYYGLNCMATVNVNLYDLPVPQNLRTENKADQITILWDMVESADYYELDANGYSITVTDTVYLHSNLLPNTQNTYRIRSCKDEYVSDWSITIVALTKLSTPENLDAVTVEENASIILTWEPVPDATGYLIFRNGEETADVALTTYTDTELENGTLYEYALKVYNAYNESFLSEPIYVNVGIEDLTLTSNLTLAKNLACKNLYLNGGTLDLNGYKLLVTENLIQSAGTLYINGGQLEVAGDYKIQSSSGGYSSGILKMVNESDYVYVGGIFLTNSCYSHESYLTAGIMEVKGDFTQKSTYVSSSYSDRKNFHASGTHKVILSGNTMQTVSFEDPGSSYSHFNILLLTKPFSSGYTFNKIPVWNYLIEGYRAPAHNGRSKGTHPATGNYSRSFTDMTVTAPGFDISITRTYNSSDNRNTHFGRGWTFSFEGSVQNYEGSSTYKKVTLPNGSVQTFIENEDGTFTAYDTRNTLTRLPDNSYILTMKDQTSYGFNSDGYLVWMKDRYKNTVNITVNSQGRVQKIIDAAGREYNITYENGFIKTIIDPAGRSVTYEYENGNLVRVKAPDGSYTRYAYDSEGFLTQIRDHNNNVLETIAYLHEPGENQHKVDYTIDAYGNEFTYAYNNLNGETTITDSNNRMTIKRYDSSYSITNSVDVEGRVVITEYYKDESNINRYWEEKSVTDRNGNKTQYQRDDNGNITKIINPDQSYREMGYDNKNNLIWEKDETGRLSYYIYDSQGIYLLKVVRPLDGTTEYIDEVSEESDFVITSYTYYTDSECQQLGYRAKGLLKSVTDPEGNTTTYTYDTYGNVATVEDPETHMMTRYEYNSIGWMEAEISRKDYRTEYDYDKNGRLIRSTLGGGETTRIVYNPTGQVIQEVSPNLYSALYDDINNNIYTGDHGTRYTYYPTGDIRAITDAAGNTTAYTYDMYGNIKTETKQNGAVYTYDYDLLNRKIKTWFREDAQSDDVLLEEYEYRILSDKKTQTVKKVYINDAETLTTIYTSDYAGRLLTQQNPDGTVQSHEYNPNGTLKSTTDPRGNTTYYKYDGQNRLSEQWSPVENNGGVKYSYKKITYDSAGRQKQISIGRELVSLYNVPSTFAATNFTYYRNSLLKSKADNEGRRTEYRYDSDGNLAAEDIYIDDETFETTEYENNHMGKPVEERKYIRKGDLYGNPFNDNDTEIIYTWFTYDNNGNLKTVTNHKGITTTYDYDNMNRQLSVSMPGEDEYSMPVTIRNASQYNWEGKVIYTEDANGNVTGYEYNKRGLLTRVINAESGVTAFWYDRAGRVTAEVTPEHYDESKSLSQMTRKEYTYDSMGRVLAETEVCYDESKSQWISFVSKAYQYDANGNITKELDALGHEYGTGSTIRQKISTGYGTEYTYNLNNQVISVLDPVSKQKGLSYKVKFTYDALGRVITETNAKGHIISYEYDDAENLLKKEVQRDANSPKQVLETYNYDYIGRLISKTDGNQNTIYFEYNEFNKLKKEIHPGDESIPGNVILYQYDESGNLKLMENSPGTQDIYTYDNLNRQTSHTSQKYDGSGKITTSVKYDPNGNVRFETNGNGNTTEKTYDAMNRLKEVKIAVSGILQTTAYSYDKNGNLIKETDWRNNSHTYTYDSLNRLIEKRDPYGKVIERLEYNNNHAQVKSCDALGNLTQYVYDRNNRLIKTIDPENNEITQAYDHLGNVSTHTDGRGNITCYYYDEMNRLEKVVNAKGEITEYTYDPNGNMLTQKDGNGHITTYEYNCAKLVVRRIDHGGRAGTPGNYTYDLAKVESYTYNADGTLATRTNRNGEATSYTYDNHGRLISETISGSTVSFTYDNNSNQLTVTDSTGTTARTYDELNRVTSKTVPYIGTVYHEYDIIDGVETGETAERTIDPKGNVTTKIYDRAGRLKIVIDGSLSSGQRTVYEYHDNGSRASITYPTGIREEYTYYPDNTLWTLTNKYSDGTVMDVYTYTYDSANNQVSKHEVINGVNKGTTSYTYDTLNRLLKVTEPTGKVTSYTYDMAGNRLTETITSNGETVKNTYSYNEQNRLEDILTRVNNVVTELTSFTYDNNGNQLETIMTEYVDGSPQSPATTVTNIYDKRNQLIQTITSDGTSVTNGYNGEGLRVSKTVNGQTAYYLYEYDKVVLEVNSSGDQKARNLYGTNLLMRTVDNETYHYIYNGHADVTALISTDGSIAATYYYDAFGNILEQTGDVDNNITYAGYQYDLETGLYYLNARMYDPKIARFLQEDTYRGNPNDPLSLNLYTYCNNNPVLCFLRGNIKNIVYSNKSV